MARTKMRLSPRRRKEWKEGIARALGEDDEIFGQFSEIQKTADAAFQSYWGESDPKPKLKKIIKQAEKLLAALEEKELEEKEDTPVDEAQQGGQG